MLPSYEMTKVIMQERLEEARQMRLIDEAMQRSPKSPSLLSRLANRVRNNSLRPVQPASRSLGRPVECN
ncbi:MAG TPA: hypothetical protein VFF68_02825 [Anaerolineaceae bacterium]|nr:hypothetical protein [Anaerolineaceae bacterium]